MIQGGVMVSRDGRWRVEVHGVSKAIVWYRLVGPNVDRHLPSTTALLEAFADVGVDLADLVEAPDPSPNAAHPAR